MGSSDSNSVGRRAGAEAFSHAKLNQTQVLPIDVVSGIDIPRATPGGPKGETPKPHDPPPEESGNESDYLKSKLWCGCCSVSI